MNIRNILASTAVLICGATVSYAAVVDVLQTEGDSSRGAAAAIIGAPADVLDNAVTNLGMQGFNEAQGVTTSIAHTIDGGGSIAAGSFVDSHMIFLNTASGNASHGGVIWTFSGDILGIMSNRAGTYESASTFELGAPGSNYTTTFPGSGPAAPFNARGIESNNGTGLGTSDGYTLFSPNQLRVSMFVSEPGDWLRVVTVAAVPVPAAMPLLLAGLGCLGFMARRKKRKAA